MAPDAKTLIKKWILHTKLDLVYCEWAYKHAFYCKHDSIVARSHQVTGIFTDKLQSTMLHFVFRP